MLYYLIAGEASGDMHGANLIKSLRAADAEAEFRFYGGDLMAAASGVAPVAHYRDTAVMGFVNVVRNARKILRNISRCKRDLKEHMPDALILIDYPGFNLKIAKYAKQELGLRIFYYIPPKAWAWKKGRVKLINRYVDEVYGIFPFEPDFYAENGCSKAVYVGNPCVQAAGAYRPGSREDFCRTYGLDPEKKLVALLPGSRRQEVADTLRYFNRLPFDQYPGCQFALAATSAVPAACYDSADPRLTKVPDRAWELLSHSYAALVNSGTATLETALIGVPQAVCYPINAPGPLYRLARRLFLKIPHISLVNIICRRDAVRELVGSGLTDESLAEALAELTDEKKRRAIFASYDDLKERLGAMTASDEAAGRIVRTLRCK